MSCWHILPSARRVLTVLLAVSQCLLLPAVVGETHLTTFSGGEAEGLARFGPGGGSSSPLQLALPASAYIKSAGLSLEGGPVILSDGRTDTTDSDFLSCEATRNITVRNGGVALSTSSGYWSQSSDSEFRLGRAENVEIDGGVRLSRGPRYSELAGEVPISPTGRGEYHPAAAVNSLNNAMLVWEDFRSGSDLDIYALYLSSESAPFGEAFAVCDAPGHQYNPAIASDRSNNFYILWQDERHGDFDIYGRKFDRRGDPVGGEFVVCNADREQERPSIAAGPGVGLLAAWDDHRSGMTYSVRAVLLDYSGSPIGDEVSFSNELSDLTSPSVCALPGGYALVWQNSTNRTGADIEGVILDQSGSPSGRPFVVSNAPHNQTSPRAASATDGGWAVVWEDRRGGGDSDIRGRRFSVDGSLVGEETPVCVARGDQLHPFLYVNSSGDTLVAWDDDRSGECDVYFKRLDASFNPLGTEQLACGEERAQDHPAALLLPSGDIIVLWPDWRGGPPDIYAKRFGAPRLVYYSGELTSPAIPCYAATYGSVGLCITLPRAARSAADTTGFELDVLDGREGYVLQSGLRPGDHVMVDTRRSDSIRLRIQMWTSDENITPVLRSWSVGTCVEDGFDVPNGGTPVGTRVRGGEVELEDDGVLSATTDDVAVRSGATDSYQVAVAKLQDGSGGFVAVWQEGSGASADILARKFSRLGAPLTSEIQVCSAPGIQEEPSVAVDLNGQFTVVWADNRSGEHRDIYGRRFDAGGDALGPEFLVCGTADDQRSPRVAVDPQNNIVVVWVDYSKAYALLYIRKFSPEGSLLYPTMQVSWTQYNLIQPALAIDCQSRIIVVWADLRGGLGENYDIYASIFNPDCTPVPSAIDLGVCVKPGAQLAPALAVDDGGEFLVAWEDAFNPLDHNILARRFDRSGAAVTGEMVISSQPGDQGHPAAAFDEDGNFMAVWHAFGDGFDVVGRHFSSAGAPVGPEFTICDVKNVEGEPADQMHPVISRGPESDFVVAWVDNRPKYDMDIWAEMYGFPGHVAAGTYLTPAYDLIHPPLSLDRAAWSASAPPRTSVSAALRTSPDGSSWSPWEQVPGQGTRPSSPPGRYIQWQFALATQDGEATPLLHSLQLSYTTYATNGTLTSPPLTPPYPIDEIEVAWEATLNGETIIVEASADNGTIWARCVSGRPLPAGNLSGPPILRYRAFLFSNGSASPVLEGVELSCRATSCPLDPWLDIGGDWTREWSFPGRFNQTVRVTGLEDAINALLSAADGEGMVLLPLVLHSGAAGVIRVFDLTIDLNTPPEVRNSSPSARELSVAEGGSVDFWVEAWDWDGDLLSYRWMVNGRPAGTRSDFRLSTDFSSSGVCSVEVELSDGFFIVNLSWRVNVLNVNRPPEMEHFPTGDVVMNETDRASFWVSVVDRDGESVSLTWLLDGRYVSDQTLYEYQTDYDSSGRHTVSVVASDGTDSTWHNWTVTVLNRNRPPVILSQSPSLAGKVRMGLGRSTEFGVEARDPDGDELRYTWRLNGKVVEGEVGPAYVCGAGLGAGSYTVSVEVSDGNASVFQHWSLSVVPGPEAGAGSSGLTTGLLATAVILAAALALAAFVYLRRSRGPP